MSETEVPPVQSFSRINFKSILKISAGAHTTLHSAPIKTNVHISANISHNQLEVIPKVLSPTLTSQIQYRAGGSPVVNYERLQNLITLRQCLLEENLPEEKEEEQMPFIVAISFCLQQPRAAHTTRSEQQSFAPTFRLTTQS